MAQLLSAKTDEFSIISAKTETWFILLQINRLSFPEWMWTIQQFQLEAAVPIS